MNGAKPGTNVRLKLTVVSFLLVCLGAACAAPPLAQPNTPTQASVPTQIAPTAQASATIQSSATTQASPPAQTTAAGAAAVDVRLQSYSVTPSVVTIKAGNITFNVTNIATDQPHQFVMIKTDLAAEKLPVGSDGTVAETAVTIVNRIAALDPGKSGSLSVNLAAGHYVLICNRPGHYQQGMHSDFTVTP